MLISWLCLHRYQYFAHYKTNFVGLQAAGNSSIKTSLAPGYALPNDEKAEATKVLGFYVQGSLMLCTQSGKTIPEYLCVWVFLRYICNTH